MTTKRSILMLLIMLMSVTGAWADYNPAWTGNQYTIRNVNNSGCLSSPGESAAMMFDSNSNTKWVVGRFFDGTDDGQSIYWYPEPTDEDVWASFETSVRVKVKSYTLTTGSDTQTYPERNPKTWQFQASNDNSNWVTLDSHTNDNTLPGSNRESRQFSIAANKQGLYRYYRLLIHTTGANHRRNDREAEDGQAIPRLEILIQLAELSLSADICSHIDSNDDNICDICGEEIPEDPANYFREGDLWYEKCEIDGVRGVKIISIAYSEGTLTIPQTIRHSRVYPVLAIGEGIGTQKEELDGYHESRYICQITFAPNSMVKVIDDNAFDEIGSESSSLGTITIPASVRSIGDEALSPDKPFEHVYFENGTQIEHLPSRIKARHIHIPASVTSISAGMIQDYTGADEVVTDIYMGSTHLLNSTLYGDWTRTHTLHVATGLRETYLKTKWATDYHFNIVEDSSIPAVSTIERYALEVQASASGSGEVIEAYANDYATKIRNAANILTALSLRNQALAEIAILIKYKDAVNDPYYSAPTEEGMRIRVKMNGGKVYEFNTHDVKNVNFINAQ